MVKTTVDGLQAVIKQQLDGYSQEIANELRSEAEKLAKEGVATLRKGGPFDGGEKSGYNEGWTSQTESDLSGFSVTIYNAKVPSLTHLLEKGHALPQGGRARAFPHIAPVEESINEQYKRKAREVLKNG